MSGRARQSRLDNKSYRTDRGESDSKMLMIIVMAMDDDKSDITGRRAGWGHIRTGAGLSRIRMTGLDPGGTRHNAAGPGGGVDMTRLPPHCARRAGRMGNNKMLGPKID